MNKISIEDIIGSLGCSYKIIGKSQGVSVECLKSASEATSNSMIWISPTRNDKQELIKQTPANIIICDNSIELTEKELEGKTLIQVKNPKLAFIDVVKSLFTENQSHGIHTSAIIHPEAKVSENVSIGPFTYIGKSVIGEGTVISGNTYIYDNVRIGKSVFIQAGCVIGSEGVNITKDDDGVWHQFPHIGGVLIEDNVRIDALCDIGKGTLGDTIIGARTKIDVGCYIAHNAHIGKDNIIIGHTMVCGSVVVGNNCWFGSNTVIRDNITIGDNVFTGMGSIVVSDLPDNAKVMGNPAKPIEEMKRILNKFKSFMVD